MDQDLTPEELDQRAQELARRVMSRPHQPQVWPKKRKPAATPARSDPAKPKRRARAVGPS